MAISGGSLRWSRASLRSGAPSSPGSSPSWRTPATGYRANHLYLMGDYRASAQLAGRVVDAANAESLDLAVEGSLQTALAYHDLADYCAAIDVLERTVSMPDGDRRHLRLGQPSPPFIRAASWLATSLASLGEFDRAMVYASEALRVAEATGDPQNLAEALDALGESHLQRWEPEKAIEAYERALEICRTWHLRTRLPSLYGALAMAYERVGRAAEAIVLATDAKAEDETLGRTGKQNPLHLMSPGSCPPPSWAAT